MTLSGGRKSVERTRLLCLLSTRRSDNAPRPCEVRPIAIIKSSWKVDASIPPDDVSYSLAVGLISRQVHLRRPRVLPVRLSRNCLVFELSNAEEPALMDYIEELSIA